MHRGCAILQSSTAPEGVAHDFPGSSAATQDMALLGSMHTPDAMIFLMHTNGELLDAAQVIKLVTTGNPNLKTLWLTILNQERGKVYEFRK
jgi:hypothetical protein